MVWLNKLLCLAYSVVSFTKWRLINGVKITSTGLGYNGYYGMYRITTIPSTMR